MSKQISELKEQYTKKRNALEDDSDVEEEEEDEFEMDDDEEGLDMQELLQMFFLDSKKNRNVCDVLLEIKRQFEVQNKILLSISEHLNK